MLSNWMQLAQAGLSQQSASDLAEATALLMRFESTLLDDENGVQTNTLGTTGSPARVTSSPQWGAGAGEIDAGVNTDENFYAQAPSNFRTGTGQAATIDFWFYPTSQGAGAGTGATLRNCIVALSSAYPVVQHPSSNLKAWFWWTETASGTFGFQNSASVTGVTINTWHHFRACWQADDYLAMWLDGTRFFISGSPDTTAFKVITMGNQYTAGLTLDGGAGNYLTKTKFDSIRILQGVALNAVSETTITVPTADFL